MQYDNFVSTNTGAKDTWGINFFQIEGEKGYIYVEGGSSSLLSIRVVTKETDQIINNQEHPDRWLYEIQNLTPLLLADDYESVYEKLEITLDTVDIIEQARKAAGICFSGDS